MKIYLSTDSDFWGATPTRAQISEYRAILESVSAEFGVSAEIVETSEPKRQHDPDERRTAAEIVDIAWRRFCMA